MKCAGCGEFIPPRISHCPSCQTETRDSLETSPGVPLSDADADRIAAYANGDIDNKSLLNEKGGLLWRRTAERPVGDYAKAVDGDPQHLLYSKDDDFKIYDKRMDSTTGALPPKVISPEKRTRPQIIITPKCTLAVVVVDGTDIRLCVRHSEVRRVSRPTYSKKSGHRGFTLVCENLNYEIPVSRNMDKERRVAGINYLESRVKEFRTGDAEDSRTEYQTADGERPTNSSDPLDDSTVAALALTNEAMDVDELVEQSSSSEEFASEMAEKLEQAWEQNFDDDEIDASSSLSELLYGLDVDLESPPAPVTDGVASKSEMAVANSTGRVARLRNQVRQTIDHADWDEVVENGKANAEYALPLALMAPYSTPLVLAGLLGSGALVDAVKTSHDHPRLNQVDTTQLMDRAHAGAAAGRRHNFSRVNASAAGAAITASRTLAEQMATDREVDSVERVDPEMVMKYAARGDRVASDDQSTVRSVLGATGGGVFGATLSQSDVSEEQAERVLLDILDDDLYTEYRKKMLDD